jgi:lysyl-tRNA synthetase class 2
MKEHGEHIESRLKKLNDLREAGDEPFAGAFDFDNSASEIIEKHGATTSEELGADPVGCSLAGRLVAMRGFGKAAFAHLDDGSGKLQIYLKKDILGDAFGIVKKLDIGDIVGVRGKLFRTKTDELTLEVDELKLLTKSIRPLPEKWHGLKDIELRYRQRYLDLIVNPPVKNTFRKRSAIIKAIREFLEGKGYIEVETPMMQRIPGGAAAKPFQTHHNALGMDLFLRIAPELYLKRLLVGGYGRIYELNRNFRNEGISTKHNPEFSMLEFYTAYKDYDYLMSLTEELIAHTAEQALGTLKINYCGWDIDLTPPWPRVPMLQAMKEKGVPEAILDDPPAARTWAKGQGIEIPSGATHAKVLDEIFGEKVEPSLIQPTFITDYPVELSPLAKRKSDDPSLVERFELYIACQEVANAFSELTDPMDQRQRFAAQAEGDEEAHRMDEEFLTALEHGMPPAAGEGIGIDRLVMILTDSPSIRDVIFFPHLRPREQPGEQQESPEAEG